MMPMTAEERKKAYRHARVEKGHTNADVEQVLGVSRESIRLLMLGTMQGSNRLRLAFAEYIGRPVEEIFTPRDVTVESGV